MISLKEAMGIERVRQGVAKPELWERLDTKSEDEQSGRTYRMKVPGGWIYRYGDQDYCYTPVMIFVSEKTK